MTEWEPEQLDEAAEDAKVLQRAAEVCESLADHADQMAEGPDGGADSEDLHAAAETCRELSVALTLALAQQGVVPDFDDDEETNDDGYGRAFY